MSGMDYRRETFGVFVEVMRRYGAPGNEANDVF